MRLIVVAVGGAVGALLRYRPVQCSSEEGLITMENVQVVKYRHSDQ